VGLLTLKVTEKIGTVTVGHHKRLHGKTTYSTAKLLKHFLHGILYNSMLPLKAVFALGILCLCLSVALGMYYLIASLKGAIAVSGWTTLVLLILFFSGITMFSIDYSGLIDSVLFRDHDVFNRHRRRVSVAHYSRSVSSAPIRSQR
jgi:dolichol-phosphate mannosyltransferase/undecaprenyl-phosphate 4-deoxy-4-formamido-L-arabinose transferase